ncbi:hypothetical protein [uncultured Flavobacterium sp.]|uniref:hypothetical protein n=1 Tax=uncultured Flavobacterium sp. TaxID=165435 RepID=UPI00292FB573|nr:hypothetical protein [uncultured Flavobacterium sp.]
MFNALTKIKEYSKLGHSMNSVSIMLATLKKTYENRGENETFGENLYVIAYVARKGILDRIDEYNWSMEGSILIPSINQKNISLFEAFTKTVSHLKAISSELNFANEVESILNKEQGYYKFEDILSIEDLKQLDALIQK